METAVLRTVLRSAVKLITRYYKLLRSAKYELDALKRELEQMVAFLDDVKASMANKDMKHERFKVWVKQIRDAVFDAEDLISYCVIQAADNRKRNYFQKIVPTNRMKLAENVEMLRRYSVKDVFEQAKVNFVNLPIADQNSTGSTSSERITSPTEQNLVAVAVRTGTLIQDLLAQSDRRTVLSIVGPPGIGKTTLAWCIYRDPEIMAQYPRVIWVDVSQEFNEKEVLLTILKKIREFNERRAQTMFKIFRDHTLDDISTKSVDDLCQLVREGLTSGKYLIIFDDVWTVEVWGSINGFLPKNNRSRVLITTRDHKVAREATGKDMPNLNVLNEEESWELLQLKVFGSLDDCPGQLTETGRQLAQSCSGLPLAIVVLGSTLRDIWRKGILVTTKHKEWESVLQFVQNDPEIALAGDGRLRKSLNLSYNSLRYDLKDCFLYLGMLPRQTEIPVAKITQLWIAEGFIHQESGRTMEEIAKQHLECLIDKNLLVVDTRKPNGEIKTCRMHNYIRSFCKMEATDLFQEIRQSREGNFIAVPHGEIENCRRICIHSSLQQFLMKHKKIRKARSFLSFSKDSFTWEKREPCMSDAFKVLRILDVNTAIKFPKFPYNLSKLVLLNYVALSGDEFKVLPREIYRLWSVQTLEVYTSSPTLTIKANIWKMMELRHFKTKAAIILIKKKKGKGGEELRTLNRLSPTSCRDHVFQKAKKLRTLGIRGELNKLPGTGSLRTLESLMKLKLQHELSTGTASTLPLLPGIQWFPKNVKIIVLSGSHLEWTLMSTLTQLDNLEVLKLKDHAFEGTTWEIKQTERLFPKLKTLHIEDANLEVWEAAGVENLAVLKKVVLKNCMYLKQLPYGDFLVTRLEMLYMDTVGNFAVNAAKQIEADKQQLRIGDAFELKVINTL